MPLSLVVVVLAAAAMHALWNARLKAADDTVAVSAVMTLAMLVCGAATVLWFGIPARAAWWLLALSALLHAGYVAAVVRAYRVADYGKIYPMMRGAAPLIAAGGAFVFLRETLPPDDIIGIVLVTMSVIALAHTGGGSWRALVAALVTAVFIAAYSVADAAGVRAADNPFGYIGLLLMVDALYIPLIALPMRGRSLFAAMRANIGAGVLCGVLSFGAYALVLYAYSRASIGAVAALREVSVFFGALIGYFWLGERITPRRRILAAALITAGGALLAL